MRDTRFYKPLPPLPPEVRIVVVGGLPGSGKSTWTRSQIARDTKAGIHSVQVETDQFLVDAKGNYVFTPQLLGEAIRKTEKRIFELWNDPYVDLIYISNTNTQPFKELRYLESLPGFYGSEGRPRIVGKFIGSAGMTVRELVEANLHNVPFETIQRMMANLHRNSVLETFNTWNADWGVPEINQL